VSFVEISKRFGTVFAGDLPTNQFAYVASLLHRNLSDTRQRLSILVERRGVADHENFRMIWNSKVWLNAHPAGAIHFSLYPFPRRRRRNTGGPDNCLAGDSFTGHDHSLAVDLFNWMAQVNLDAELLQMFFGDFRKRGSKCAENVPICVDQNDTRFGWIDSSKVGAQRGANEHRQRRSHLDTGWTSTDQHERE